MIRPRKRFGQNFLVDPQTISDLINAIAPQPDDAIIEIGPGLGALTKPLLEHVKKLEVIELDRDLIGQLEKLAQDKNQLVIYQQDALQFNFASENKSRRIVGNLPYNISTPLLFHLFAHLNFIQDMHFMLQKEVIDRMCAHASDRSWSRLSVMVQTKCTTQKLFEIEPQKFKPAPKVTSGFIRLTPLQQPIVPHTLESIFESVVRSAFAHPRKTLANNLKGIVEISDLEKLDIDPSIRPQYTEIEQFLAIAKIINH